LSWSEWRDFGEAHRGKLIPATPGIYRRVTPARCQDPLEPAVPPQVGTGGFGLIAVAVPVTGSSWQRRATYLSGQAGCALACGKQQPGCLHSQRHSIEPFEDKIQ